MPEIKKKKEWCPLVISGFGRWRQEFNAILGTIDPLEKHENLSYLFCLKKKSKIKRKQKIEFSTGVPQYHVVLKLMRIRF